jgi:hypothetical protein
MRLETEPSDQLARAGFGQRGIETPQPCDELKVFIG